MIHFVFLLVLKSTVVMLFVLVVQWGKYSNNNNNNNNKNKNIYNDIHKS